MRDLGERKEYLKYIDDELGRLWRLGRNAIIGWSAARDGIEVLVVPQFLLPSLLSNYEDILVGSSKMTKEKLRSISDVCEIEPYKIKFPFSLKDNKITRKSIDELIQRYAITKINDRAVLLFDIVGFSLYSPLEQVTALNSLSYSINIAHRRARERGLNISLAHSPTGDGFYVWSGATGLDANIDLFCLMMLILADNALGARKGSKGIVPDLRSCFHVGSCYEYFQVSGQDWSTSHFIVGDVTIDLARMIDSALPHQILVGGFLNSVDGTSDLGSGFRSLNTVQFIDRAKKRLGVFEDVSLAREKVTEINCYLTGEGETGGPYNISRFVIVDKHGIQHEVFNAKVNIHRRRGAPVYLGRQSRDLEDFEAADRREARSSLPKPEVVERSANKHAGAHQGDPAGHETILVVDDDADVRETSVMHLENLGYRVLEAENGPSAMAVLDDEKNIDLLFTDMVMPGGMDGPALARHVLEHFPNVRVLFTSGYAEEAVSRHDESVDWISKPFLEQDLGRKVRAVLDAPMKES